MKSLTQREILEVILLFLLLQKGEKEMKSLTHREILEVIPADVCRGCLIRPLVCKKKQVDHPSFHCNGIRVITRILEAARNE